jgi:glycosyltransferase involved in cell wall biosynthesis
VTGRSDQPTLVSDFAERIHGVTVVPMEPGPTGGFERSLVGMWSLATKALAGFASIVRLTWYVHRRRIDVVHTNDRPRDALAAVCIGKVTGTTSVLHAHVLYGDWMSPALRWAYRQADHVIAVSDFVRDGLISAGLDPARLFTVHNAIELHRWEPETESDVRSDFGIPDDAPVIVTACRLFEEKGVAPLIEAVGEVHRRHPDVRLLVIGDEPDAEDGFLRKLNEQVAGLRLDDAVFFLGYRNDVVSIMAAAEVFAMPSFEEPFGLVFAEAMAMCLPVIGLDNGGTREVVRHGLDGLLSAPGDHAALVNHLTLLIEDPDLRRRMGEAGRTRAEQSFTVERMVSEVARVYRLVV